MTTNPIDLIDLTPEQIEVLSGTCHETVLRWLRSGQLKSRRLGARTYRITYADYFRFQRDKEYAR